MFDEAKAEKKRREDAAAAQAQAEKLLLEL